MVAFGPYLALRRNRKLSRGHVSLARVGRGLGLGILVNGRRLTPTQGRNTNNNS